MGAEGGCCSGGTDEALKSELDRYQRGPKDPRPNYNDWNTENYSEASLQGQKSPHKKKKGADDQEDQQAFQGRDLNREAALVKQHKTQK